MHISGGRQREFAGAGLNGSDFFALKDMGIAYKSAAAGTVGSFSERSMCHKLAQNQGQIDGLG